MMLNCISVFLLILLISNISIILNYIHWIPVARFTSWSCRWGQGICRSAWEMTSLVCTREFLSPNFFKTQWFWAQVGMLVLNAMNGLTRMRGTLELRRDTGAPSINKSLIVLANAFRCVHPAVRPGADLHFKPTGYMFWESCCCNRWFNSSTHFSNHALPSAPIKKHGISKQLVLPWVACEEFRV